MNEPITTNTPTDTPTAPIKKENPLLTRINKIPGQKFRLPSLGAFYKNGELDSDVANGEIEVFPMTTLDEVLIKSPDLLYSGEAVERVFRRCIPSVLAPKKLLSKDVDFLLICLRKVTYGNDVEVTTKCSHCIKAAEEKAETDKTKEVAEVKDNTYMLSLDYFIKNTKNIDMDSLTSSYTKVLSNGQRVELKPVIFEDFIAFSQNDDNDLTADIVADRINNNYLMLIEAVDGCRDKALIKEWLTVLPIILKSEIETGVMGTADFGTEFVYKTKCKDCKKELEIRTVLNPVYFFTLPSNQKTTAK